MSKECKHHIVVSGTHCSELPHGFDYHPLLVGLIGQQKHYGERAYAES